MTQDEQKQFDHLQQQLNDATRSAERLRVYLSSALERSLGEARMYRNLFWLLLLLAIVTVVVRILQK
jgi:hypothetical protein